MEILRLEKATKEYLLKGETIRVLRAIDLVLEAGEFVALMGPSGSGKTTLLHLMGGIDPPTSGRIFLGDREISGLSPKELSQVRLYRLGFIFQSYNLLPAMTVLDNCAYPLILQGIPGKERRRRTEEMLAKVGMSHRLWHRPEDLSGGEQQRVAIARALITRPLLVLADEPTAHLDAETGREIIELMHRLNREEGTTFLFATHDPALIRQTQRILRLQGGRIVEKEPSAS
jgi:putative ABC transport system ATP-binding protein